MQHFITLENVAYESFKTFRTNLAWQSNRAVTGGGGGVDFFTKIEEGPVKWTKN